VFSVQAPAKLTVSDMTITNAAPVGNDAGALRIDPGAAADVARVAITRHATVGQSGSAISNNGTLTIHDSLIADNHTTASGAVRSPGTASFTNVTFSGNRAGSSGGALQASFGTSVTTLNNVTFAGNVADDDNDGSGDGGAFTAGNVFTIKNSIVAGNVDRGGEEPDCAGTVTSGGHNLVGNPSGCDGFAGAGDLTGVNPKLGQLADNGGPTRTHSVPKDSPAVNAGGTDCAATDQRGLPRSACDIGSYELVLCGKAEVKVIGTEGPDVLTGTAAGDGMIGLGGKDTLRGKGGKDGLCGGPGKDTLRGGAGKDRLVGGPGRDTCAGQAGRDRARSCERERSL
jgi:predicted outer membrane repeat protein